MKLKGIDVSAYNPIKNYKTVAKNGVQFAILKVMRKDLTPDALFEKHWVGFESANVPIQGVYNYSYAFTVDKARSDAKKVIQILNDRKPMVWLDIEEGAFTKLGHTLIDIINAYGKEITSAGLKFGVYTYISFYNRYIKPYENEVSYPFWIARYPSMIKTGINQPIESLYRPQVKNLYGWQYSSQGLVTGVDSYVDLDEWYVEIEAQTDKKLLETSELSEAFRAELATSLKKSTTLDPQKLLNYTVTISASKNNKHASVTALERFLKAKGYYNGSIEADLGKKPVFGNGMTKATALYQTEIVGLKKADNEWTKKGLSYKTALGLR